MSWQQYVDNNLVGTHNVTKGAIYGTDGSKWAISPGFNVAPAEVKALITAFKDPSGLRANGLHLANEKYMVLKTDERSIYFKKGAGGGAAVKTGKAILIGLYDDKIQPGNCTNVVEKLADYLIEQGY